MADQDWFTETFSSTAVEDAPAADAVIDTAAPEPDPTPPVVNVETAPVPAPVTVPDPVAPAVPETPVVQWESPDNPLYEDAMLARQIKQHAAETARLREQTEVHDEMVDLSDGDASRMQRLTGLVAKQTAPLVQQVEAFKERANGSEKTLAAFYIAAKAHLSDEQIKTLVEETNDLMTLEGSDVMERTAFGKRDLQRNYEAKLSAIEAENLALRQQLASQGQLSSREANGVDLVDNGTGAPPDMSLDDRLRAAPDMDTFMELQFGARRAS